ncbi:hypothetical protein BC826DRAFT_1126804 [Russula brevipes]|nr:hypothetical protein BC826DRAFT_1126804 [Russula brevipes]
MTVWSHFLLLVTFTDTGPLGRHEGTAMCEWKARESSDAVGTGRDARLWAMMQVDNTAMVSATPAMEIRRSHCSFGKIAEARGLPLFLEHCRTLPPNMINCQDPDGPGETRDNIMKYYRTPKKRELMDPEEAMKSGRLGLLDCHLYWRLYQPHEIACGPPSPSVVLPLRPSRGVRDSDVTPTSTPPVPVLHGTEEDGSEAGKVIARKASRNQRGIHFVLAEPTDVITAHRGRGPVGCSGRHQSVNGSRNHSGGRLSAHRFEVDRDREEIFASERAAKVLKRSVRDGDFRSPPLAWNRVSAVRKRYFVHPTRPPTARDRNGQQFVSPVATYPGRRAPHQETTHLPYLVAIPSSAPQPGLPTPSNPFPRVQYVPGFPYPKAAYIPLTTFSLFSEMTCEAPRGAFNCLSAIDGIAVPVGRRASTQSAAHTRSPEPTSARKRMRLCGVDEPPLRGTSNFAELIFSRACPVQARGKLDSAEVELELTLQAIYA